MKKYIPAFCFSIILLSSCTMEKRLYRPGLHIDFTKAKTSPHKSIPSIKENVNLSVVEDNLIASNDNSNIITNAQLTPNIFNSDSCDNIILKNGNEISAKVIEVGVKEIKYKKCPDNNDPLYSIKKSEVFMIKYPDGSKDIMPEEKKEVDEMDDEDRKILDEIKQEKKKPKTDFAGVFGFVFSLVGFGIAWFISMLVGVAPLIVGLIFGIISLVRIGRRPEKHKGRGFGIVAIIVSTIMIVAIIAILAV